MYRSYMVLYSPMASVEEVAQAVRQGKEPIGYGSVKDTRDDLLADKKELKGIRDGLQKHLGQLAAMSERFQERAAGCGQAAQSAEEALQIFDGATTGSSRPERDDLLNLTNTMRESATGEAAATHNMATAVDAAGAAITEALAQIDAAQAAEGEAYRAASTTQASRSLALDVADDFIRAIQQGPGY